jgi:hypothetical protein
MYRNYSDPGGMYERKLHSEELDGGTRNACRIVMGNSPGNRPLGSRKRIDFRKQL